MREDDRDRVEVLEKISDLLMETRQNMRQVTGLLIRFQSEKAKADRQRLAEGSVTDGHLPLCSFCGKSRRDVETLIAGPTVFICNECVTLCMSVIQGEAIQTIPDLDQDDSQPET